MSVTPLRAIRVPGDVWDPAQQRAADEATSVSAEVLAFLRAYAAGERYVLKARPRP